MSLVVGCLVGCGEAASSRVDATPSAAVSTAAPTTTDLDAAYKNFIRADLRLVNVGEHAIAASCGVNILSAQCRDDLSQMQTTVQSALDALLTTKPPEARAAIQQEIEGRLHDLQSSAGSALTAANNVDADGLGKAVDGLLAVNRSLSQIAADLGLDLG